MKKICIKPLVYYANGKIITLLKDREYDLPGLDHHGRGDLKEYLRDPGIVDKVIGKKGKE